MGYIEISSPGVCDDGQVFYDVDLIDDDGRINMWSGRDYAEALESAEGYAEGDGSPGDRIPIVNLVVRGSLH